MAEAAKSRRTSGKSGKNLQPGMLTRQERDGQIDEWRAAAERAGMTLLAWTRATLDKAAKKSRQIQPTPCVERT